MLAANFSYKRGSEKAFNECLRVSVAFPSANHGNGLCSTMSLNSQENVIGTKFQVAEAVRSALTPQSDCYPWQRFS